MAAADLRLSVQQLQALLDAPARPPAEATEPFRVTTQPPSILFDKDRNPFPVQLYFPRDTTLILNVANSNPGATYQLGVLFLHPDGSISLSQYLIAPSADRTVNVLVAIFGEGFLLEAAVVAQNQSTKRGHAYISLVVQKGSRAAGTPVSVLMHGYCYFGFAPTWPPGIAIEQTSGDGLLRSIAATIPAAGVEVSETVPASARWLLRETRMILTTSAAVATRFPSLVVTDGVNLLGRWEANQGATAGQALRCTASGAGGAGQAVAGQAAILLPTSVPLFAGWTWGTQTSNIDVGDTWTAIHYVVEEHIEM